MLDQMNATPVTRLLCPKCSSPKMKAIPFGNVSIILGCMECKHTYQVDFDIPDDEPTQKPEPKPAGQDQQQGGGEFGDNPDGTADGQGDDQDQDELDTDIPDELDSLEDDQEEGGKEGYPDDVDMGNGDWDGQPDDDQDQDQEGPGPDDPAHPWEQSDGQPGTQPEPSQDDDAQDGQEAAQDVPDELVVVVGGETTQSDAQGQQGGQDGQAAEPGQQQVDSLEVAAGGDQDQQQDGATQDSQDVPDTNVRIEAGANAQVVDFRARKEKIGTARKFGQEALRDMQVRTFVRKMGDVLKDNAQDRWVGGKRTGKLWDRALYKVPTGSDRVFGQRQARQNKAYNVCILVDCSGSMRGWLSLTAKMTQILVEGLSQHNVRFSVVAYSTRVSIIKNWNDAQTGQQVRDNLTNWYMRNAHLTCTFAGVLEAEHLLKQQTDGHNVLVLVTDGKPSSGEQVTDRKTGKRYSAATGLDYVTGRETLRERCQHIQKYIPNSDTVTGEAEFMQVMLRRLSRLVTRV
jgi:uncharacterized protein with von Willebrand factor type A (vWA) domain